MKQAVDSMLSKYPSFEENLRKAANQDIHIDIPGIFRVAQVPNPVEMVEMVLGTCQML
jgi:hypothetical protein